MADNEIRLNVTAVESEPLNVCVEQVPMNPVNVENTYKGIDYNLLKNKPSIDGVTLEGDKTTAEVIGFDKEYVDEAILTTNAKIDSVEQDLSDRIDAVSTDNFYTKEEIDNKVIVIEADIDAQADAIQKTRSDFMESDSELQQQINAHANELTTQKNDIDELGDQVAGIESKIPEGTSDTNPLINRQQLLDEEMDMRSDFNESVSELQTQITAQASAIANKVDVTGDTMTGALNLPELNVATSEGTLNLSITAGVATIATNNGLDIVSQTKFDTAPTTDDSTTWADALDTALVRKAQVATAIAEAGGGGSVPDNVYTSDNLIAGENVTFTEVPPEGGIDEHTLACWHFDDADGTYGDNSLDSVSGMGYPDGGVNTNKVRIAAAKFGSAGLHSSYQKHKDFSLSSEDEWTIDCWWKPLSQGASFSAGIGQISNSYQRPTYYHVFFDSARTRNKIYISPRASSMYEGNVQEVDANFVANQYYHIAAQKNKNGVISAYVNGVKVIEYEGNVRNESTYLGFGSNNGHIDELRISKVSRYTDDFTPPTKAYTVATGPSKTAVNAIIPTKTSELENDSGFLTGLPDNVYTQTNLLGGKDIEIVPEPVEGGIDEYTVACWHFDGNQIDEVSEQSFSDGNYTYQIGKFGNSLYKGSSDNYVTSRNLLSSLNTHTMEEFTIDFWFSFDNSSSYAIACTGNNINSINIYYVKISPFSILLSDDSDGSNYYSIKEKYTFPATLTYGRYYHVALQVNNFVAKIFFDGKEVLSADFTSAGLSSTATGFMVRGFVSKIDEFRISDCVRYTEDFTPPTKAYSLAEPTGNMVVNGLFSVERVMPDYSTFTTVAASTNFVAPTSGYVSYVAGTNTDTSDLINSAAQGYISINGAVVLNSTYTHGSDGAHPDSGFFPCAKGDIVLHTYTSGTVYFYPCKGA